MTAELRIGTRRQRAWPLRRPSWWPVHCVRAGAAVDLVGVTTPGDRSSAPVAELGVGVFVSALRDALAAGEVDVAVHSLQGPAHRGRPTAGAGGRPPASDPRDALVARDGMVLGELPPGATVGTAARRAGWPS